MFAVMGMWDRSSSESRGPGRSPSGRAEQVSARTAPQGPGDDALALQGVVGNRMVQRMLARRASAPAGAPSRRGLPAGLRTGIERLSGVSMDDVRVHYNSDKPREVGAAAYTAHTDIHVATGEEQHLAHEAWHVVQQKQGRVAADSRVGEVAVNRNAGLEHEATRMGERASRLGAVTPRAYGEVAPAARPSPTPAQPVRQLWAHRTVGQGTRATIRSPALDAIVGQGVAIAGPTDVKLALHHNHWMFLVEDQSVQQYRITDNPVLQFYTAVTAAREDAIIRKRKPLSGGMNYTSKANPDFNSRGYIYFGLTPDICRDFADRCHALGPDWHMLRFTLPYNTLIQADPELPLSGALRAAVTVPASRFTLYETPAIRRGQAVHRND